MSSHSMLGAYGSWAATLAGEGPNFLSFRHTHWTDLAAWRPAARQRFRERVAMPDTGGAAESRIERQYEYDGLQVEELSWQLPYGPRTEAVLLKPAGASGPLPGVLALHDHGGHKFHGWQKITRTRDEQNAVNTEHQQSAYGGVPWANRLAQRGYAVLVPDAFAFGSRRIRIADLPPAIRDGLDEQESDDPNYIAAYNRWAAGHESILAKSLFSAGTTWAGVWLAEDLYALDLLCARDDVDAQRVGIGGLSGGGLRTVYLAGLDDRVRCAVCVGMMTTWRDLLLNKSHTHTWMIYVPHLATEMDYPDILGMRAPLPTLVQNNTEDPLFTLAEMRRADVMLRQVYEKAGAAGGTVAMPAMDVMDSGRMIIIQDPTGAMVGLWQPKGHIGAQLVNMPNALVWNELQTKDVDAAMRFYGTVFGWGHDQDPNGYQMFKLGERMQAGMLKMDESWGEIPPNWGVYFMSEDIEATAAKAKELGGVIHVPPTSTGTVGTFSVIQDPQGGFFTAMQFDGPVDPPPGY